MDWFPYDKKKSKFRHDSPGKMGLWFMVHDSTVYEIVNVIIKFRISTLTMHHVILQACTRRLYRVSIASHVSYSKNHFFSF